MARRGLLLLFAAVLVVVSVVSGYCWYADSGDGTADSPYVFTVGRVYPCGEWEEGCDDVFYYRAGVDLGFAGEGIFPPKYGNWTRVMTFDGVYDDYGTGDVVGQAGHYNVVFSTEDKERLARDDFGPVGSYTIDYYQRESLRDSWQHDFSSTYWFVLSEAAVDTAVLELRAIDSVTGAALSGFSYTVAGGPSGFDSIHGVCAGFEVEHSVPVVSSLSLDDYYIVGGSLDGYETPLAIMTAVPDGGALVTLRFKPLAPEPPVDAGTVLIRVLDSDTGGGVASYTFKVGPAAALGDYNGFASVIVEPGRHPWGVLSTNHHPAGGYVDVVANETVDLGVVYTVRRTSESPPPPTPPPELIDDIPDPETLPPFSLVDSCSWRQTIERNSLVATFASPLLDAFDTLFGVIDDMMLGIFRALLGPFVSFVGYVAGVVDLVESIVDGVVDVVSPVTTSIGLVILAIPEKVVALGTFALTLNCVLLILRGPIM